MTIYQVIALEKDVIDNILVPLDMNESFYVDESLHRSQDGSLVSVQEKITKRNFNNHDIFCFAVKDISEKKRAEERRKLRDFFLGSMHYSCYSFVQKEKITQIPRKLKFCILKQTILTRLASIRFLSQLTIGIISVIE